MTLDVRGYAMNEDFDDDELIASQTLKLATPFVTFGGLTLLPFSTSFTGRRMAGPRR